VVADIWRTGPGLGGRGRGEAGGDPQDAAAVRGFTGARRASCRRRARGLMICADRQAGTRSSRVLPMPVPGNWSCPMMAGRPVRATRPQPPCASVTPGDQLTGPSPGRRAHIAESGRVAARCLVVIRATRSTSSGRAAFSLAVRMMTSQVLGDSGLRNFPKGDSLHPNGVPFQSCQDHCREPATNNKR
jgi:hypothetical protein